MGVKESVCRIGMVDDAKPAWHDLSICCLEINSTIMSKARVCLGSCRVLLINRMKGSPCVQKTGVEIRNPSTPSPLTRMWLLTEAPKPRRASHQHLAFGTPHIVALVTS